MQARVFILPFLSIQAAFGATAYTYQEISVPTDLFPLFMSVSENGQYAVLQGAGSVSSSQYDLLYTLPYSSEPRDLLSLPNGGGATYLFVNDNGSLAGTVNGVAKGLAVTRVMTYDLATGKGSELRANQSDGSMGPAWLNDAGQLAGQTNPTNKNLNKTTWVFQDDQFSYFAPPLPGSVSISRSDDPNLQIGFSLSGGSQLGWAFTKHGYVVLQPPTLGALTACLACNHAGTVTGMYGNSALRWNVGKTPISLAPAIPGDQAYGTAIDDNGRVLGIEFGTEVFTVLWDADGTARPLLGLLPAEVQANVALGFGLTMDCGGRVFGFYSDLLAQSHVFILSPIAQP